MVVSPITDWTAPATDAGTAGAALARIAIRRPGSVIRISDTENARSNSDAVAVTEIESAPALTAPGRSPCARSDRRTASTVRVVAPKRRANCAGVR